MGLSASQSRYLTLTARLCDLELKAQTIQNHKIRLAEQSTAASKAYMDALDAETLKFNYYNTGSVNATVQNITESGVYRVADMDGNFFDYYEKGSQPTRYDSNGVELSTGWYKVSSGKGCSTYETDDDAKKPFTYTACTGTEAGFMKDTTWLYNQLQIANLVIQKKNIDKGQWEDYSYTGSSLFTTEDDDTGLARAEAEYEFTMSEIESKDKRFDLDLDNIETEHKAVDKEMESVKGVVKNNVERTFKIFS